MRRSFSHLLTCTLLATYAGIALLGQGLHLLAPGCEGGHHEHFLAAQEAHDHAGDHHSSDSNGRADESNSVADLHPCEICVFLAHSVSEPPQIATVPFTQPLVAAAHCDPQGLYSLAIGGLHVARGPPQHVA